MSASEACIHPRDRISDEPDDVRDGGERDFERRGRESREEDDEDEETEEQHHALRAEERDE